MNISITGRHFEVSDGLKKYIDKKVNKIKYYFSHIINVNLVLEVTKLDHIAEITVMSDSKTFVCEVTKNDMYSSIDILFDKIERQIIRNKEKFKQRKGKLVPDNFSNLGKEIQTESNIITKIKEVTPKPKGELEALLQLSLNKHKFEIFNNEMNDKLKESIVLKQNDDTFAIIKKEDVSWIKRNIEIKNDKIIELDKSEYTIHDIELNKAIEKFYSSPKEQYIIFNDPELNSLNILYLRKDKTLALITSGEVL